MRSTERMNAEEIARATNSLSDNTVSRLLALSKAMASNKTAMALMAECCPPGIPPHSFAIGVLIGMAVADEFQATHGIIIPSNNLIS